MVHQINLA
jgi:cytochrome o ubiquinol oxidase subunit 1